MHACINGTLAGLVGVTSAPHLYSAGDAIVVGMLCAMATHAASEVLIRLKIDDPIGAFPVHGAAGVVGALLVALLGDFETINQNGGRFEQLQIQLLGISTVALWSFGLTIIILRTMNIYLPLRVSENAEVVGLNISEHDESTDLIDLMANMNSVATSGEMAIRVPVEPHILYRRPTRVRLAFLVLCPLTD